MTPKDWLQQELLRGVYDNELQKKLLQQRNPTLEDLINIATLYQNADSAQVPMAKEPMEDVRRTTDQEPPPPSQIPSDDEDRRSDRTYNHEAKRISDYKKENKSRWNNQQSNNRPPSTRQGPPNQFSYVEKRATTGAYAGAIKDNRILPADTRMYANNHITRHHPRIHLRRPTQSHRKWSVSTKYVRDNNLTPRQ